MNTLPSSTPELPPGMITVSSANSPQVLRLVRELRKRLTTIGHRNWDHHQVPLTAIDIALSDRSAITT